MSDEEINRKIAEACGWTGIKQIWDGSWCGLKPGVEGWPYDSIPPFTKDLNAMHEAEKASLKDKRRDYEHNLRELIAEQTGYSFSPIYATAHQRALAFLKTVAPKL